MKVLYTTGDAIWLAENGKAYELPSYRALQYKETIREIRERKEWKTTGRGAQFMGVAEMQPKEDPNFRIGGVALYGDEFLYTLSLDASGGLYRRDFSEKPSPEGLICSGNDMFFGAIARHEDDVAACVLHENGSSHIGLLHLPQSYCTEITDGDSVESSPSWSPDGRVLYFSTCGIARTPDGMRFSPNSIAMYNVNTQRMDTVLEDEKYDYLSPKTDEADNLWYIRQPYSAGEKRNESIGSILLDVLLFPVRLVMAIFGFLNAFSMLFGGQSLRSGKQSGNTRSKQKSDKELFFEGNLIQAEKNLKENSRSGEAHPGILPRSRVLICRKPDGSEEIFAKGVLDYSLCKDGVVYSNGSHILHRKSDGQTEEIVKTRLASRLQIIE